MFPTKPQCLSTQYIASKPDKFSIKLWLPEYIYSKYLWKGRYYAQAERIAGNVILDLSAPYLNRGINITTDNLFTSLKLVEALKKKKQY